MMRKKKEVAHGPSRGAPGASTRECVEHMEGIEALQTVLRACEEVHYHTLFLPRDRAAEFLQLVSETFARVMTREVSGA